MASPSQPDWIYEVFLSFRGPESRHAIISHIYRDLDTRGIYTFKDDEKLKQGEPVSQALIQAIEKSRIAVIIFTPDFASSAWCLKEVAEIMECKKTKNLIVLPVFYCVDPNEVRNQRNGYGEAFRKHNEKPIKDPEDAKKWKEEVEKWKKALEDAGSLYGSEINVWAVAESPQETPVHSKSGESRVGAESPKENPIHLESREFRVKKNFRKGTSIQTGGQFRTEAELVESIVREIWIQLNPTPLDVAKFPVGLVSRVDKLILDFKMKSKEEILTIGFCSMGGMGKTTLARALYNSIFKDFEGSAYVDDIRGTLRETEKMVLLQKNLVSQMLTMRKEEILFNSDAAGSRFIKERLCRKRVLLILDGVDQMGQINSLADKPDWFGKGSRIIITTTNEDLIKATGAVIHKVERLGDPEARELFRKHASGSRNRIINVHLVDRALQCTQRVPLALEVLGRAFAVREENEWESKLEDFAKSSDQSIDKVLRISYDALDYKKQQIFLHIACFFNGWNRRYVEGVLKKCEPLVETEVNGLIRRSLIMDENGTVRVHDLIELMGKNIVVSECHGDVAKRSRLWRLMDVHNVLSRDVGTDAVEAIVLAPPEPEKIEICSDALKKLENLRFLIMINVHTDFRDPIYLPRELRWFEWPECPASCLKLIYPDNLAVLAVRRSLFEEPREP